MRNLKTIATKLAILLVCLSFTLVSCERDPSDDVEFAKFPATGDIFTDTPIGLGSNFYFPFLGSKPTAWTVDDNVSFQGNASMRFDIPNVGDPEGSFAGAIFRIDGDNSGRDLTGFDALTFWAKATEARTIDNIGFGQDFLGNTFQAQLTNPLQLTTNWQQYIIPIPDPSVLVRERGMLWYSEGPSIEDGTGYTFWIDELRFEKLGTVAQPRPAILGGEDVTEAAFIGATINLAERGLTQTYNLASGLNQTVTAAPAYFTFSSSNPEVARVNAAGIVEVFSDGMATITASIAGVNATGSLTISSLGDFDEAPTPTRPAETVISVFSDAYTNIPVDYFNGFFTPDGQTTLGGAPPIRLGTGEIINYTMLNFVGIGFFDNVPTVNATNMTHIHVDINVQEALDSGDFLRLQLLNAVGSNETSGSVTLSDTQLASNAWVSFDIPLTEFTGLTDRSALGLFFFISDNTISNIYVDNIYFYRE